MAEALLAPAFLLLDTVGVVPSPVHAAVAGNRLYLALISLISLTCIIQLYKSEGKVDALNDRIRVKARIESLSWNTHRTEPENVAITTQIYWDIWTDVDVDTDDCALNIIGVYKRSWKCLWLRQRKQMLFGLRSDGQYRKKISAKGEKPFSDSAKFSHEWRHDPSVCAYQWELVVTTGSPRGRYIAELENPHSWAHRDERAPL